MATGDQRPKHQRQQSKAPKTVNKERNIDTGYQSNGRQSIEDSSTVDFIKRMLCAQSSAARETNIDLELLHKLLPPLTSSNEVDVQLYAIIAVILSQFVQLWYNRITPDQDFVAEIVQIIAHCTRGIEERLRHVDLEDLLLDELPAVVVAHIDAVRIAQDACSHDRAPSDVRMIYHSLYPNKALTPLPDNDASITAQEENEIAWSQLLVSRVLPLVLPPEDLQNPCLHVLVSEIFSEMIVHNAMCGRASEPWVLWEGVTKLLNSLRPVRTSLTEASPSPTTKLEQLGLIPSTEAADSSDLQKNQHRRLDAIAQVCWTTLQVIAMAWLFLRSFVTALMHASSIQARQGRVGRMKTSDKVPISAVAPDSRPNVPQHTILCDRRPVIDMRVWTCISRLTLIEKRMPWLSGALSLFQWLSLRGPGGLCDTNSALDRLMSSKISEILSRPSLLPSVLRAIRGAIFPEFALGPTRAQPTSAEIAEIKRECATTIVEMVPKAIRSRYFATQDKDLMRRDVESTLDLFGDSYVNKHLIISAVELLVVRLFPELAEDGVDT